MFTSRIATTALTATLAVVPATALLTSSATAAPAAHNGSAQVRQVCDASAALLKTPGKGLVDILSKGQSVKVKRVSANGQYSYGFARGSANRNAWIKTSALCSRSTARSSAVAPTRTSVTYTVRTSSAVILKTPGKGFLATLSEGQSIRVSRLSASGQYAYGFARGNANRHGWVKCSALYPHSGGIGDPRVHGRF